jgi:hypothetical protein
MHKAKRIGMQGLVSLLPADKGRRILDIQISSSVADGNYVVNSNVIEPKRAKLVVFHACDIVK